MSAPQLVFICYADADRRIAERLHRTLEQSGLHPWCKALDLIPGQEWDTVIPGVLRQAAAVLVIVTSTWSMVGDADIGWYGPEEIALAIDHARRVDPRMAIVPVRLDGAGVGFLPYGLRRLTEIEATASDLAPVVDGLNRVLAHRSRILRSPEAPVLDARLAEILKRIAALEARGADPVEVEEAITAKIAIKRRLREGGQLEAGDALDRYILAERLGHGGFASVWRAWDPSLGEHVAIKVLHGRWNKDRSRVERFQRGVRQMARLKHPAVVPVLDADREDQGWHYFVMTWMPGGDLYDAITRADYPLSADEGLRAVLEVAEALAMAHRQGVVHRDVKPRNILLDTDGRAKLSDFDLVRALDTTGGTGTGAMGTFIYAAPEQLDRPQDVGPRTDVYALGMTAIFVLTGKQPATMTKWHPAKAIDRLPASPAVRACLLRSIALHEHNRPIDAEVFAAELRSALAPACESLMFIGERMDVPNGAIHDLDVPQAEKKNTPDPAAPSSNPPQVESASDVNVARRASLILAAMVLIGLVVVAGVVLSTPAATTINDAGVGTELANDARTTDVAVPFLPDGGLPETALRPALVPIHAGEFTMGSPKDEVGRDADEQAHQVRLTGGFLMANTEVTQAQYAALMGENPSAFQGGEADGERPVERVRWLDAVSYCNALSKAEGLEAAYSIDGDTVTWNREALGYRLPTEAEWEYAARASNSVAVEPLDAHILDQLAWYGGNSGSTHPRAWDASGWEEKPQDDKFGSTHPVGSKWPNEWGLYDMRGNVWEWMWDWHSHTAYGESPRIDPYGPTRGHEIAIRGGCFANRAEVLRLANRSSRPPAYKRGGVGFRPVRRLAEAPPIQGGGVSVVRSLSSSNRRDASRVTVNSRQDYTNRLTIAIKSQFDLPSIIPADVRMRLMVTLSFRVDAEGQVINEPQIVTSSGNPFFDEAALNAIRKFGLGSAQRLPLPQDERLRAAVLERGLQPSMYGRDL